MRGAAMREEELKGKKIVIWGYGREGKSTEQFLLRHCSPSDITVYEGDRAGIDEEKYDLIFKSPGIVMEEEHPKYTSQTEFFLEHFKDRVIGITGTKGKSTTASLLYHVLDECSDKHALLLGNIGIPCMDFFDLITEDTVVVFELSCHQLAHVKVSPHVAVLLNLYEEHLDYYKTYENYVRAKKNIAKFQTKDDLLLVGENIPEVETKAQMIRVKREEHHPYQLQILGEHNAYNAQFVYDIATKVYGCDAQKVAKSMEGFHGLSHRLEYVGEKDGIHFYDDSISTIPEAVMNAVKCVPKVQTVIVGGMDRKIHYEQLARFIQADTAHRYICCYESGRHIYELAGQSPHCILVEDLKEAVEAAKRITEPGRACVLSPAAPSYGYFKNFEERGDVFQRYALEETGEPRK